MHHLDANNLIIIAAVDFEFSPLKKLFPDAIFFEFGIGALAAAARISAAKSKFENKDILYIGTAGTFSKFENVEVVRASTVAWLPTCQRQNLSYSVEKNPLLTLNSHSQFASISPRNVVCAPNVSLVDNLPAELTPKNTIENIELYSVASHLLPIAKSFTAVLGITNAVGKNSHEQWKANFKTAANEIALTLQNISHTF